MPNGNELCETPPSQLDGLHVDENPAQGKKWTEIGKSASLRDGADKGKAKAEQAQKRVQKLKGWERTLRKVLVIPELQAELGESFGKSTVLFVDTTLPKFQCT